MSCCHSHTCQHTSSTGVEQTLDEMEFERGVWYAAQYGDLNRVKILLEKPGADVDQKATGGYTALHYASRNGHYDVVKYLIARGANIDALTMAGQATPLHRAVSAGHYDIVDYLLNKGANVELVDGDGKTALHRAAEYCKTSKANVNNGTNIYELIKSKMSNGLHELKDKKGKTASDYL